MPKSEFEGTFIKIKKPTPLQEEYGPPIRPSIYECFLLHSEEGGMEFDEEIYKQVGNDIKSILGDKEKYSLQEAVRYFQTKYLAYRVPFKYAFYYQDPYLHKNYKLCRYSIGGEFEYDTTSGEKNITLVVDTIYNKSLREKYPKIEQFEKVYYEREVKRYKEYKKDLQQRKALLENTSYLEPIVEKLRKRISQGEIGHNNPLIVIGYFEENIINSMYILNNFPIAIDDIHYEMYYFYKHS